MEVLMTIKPKIEPYIILTIVAAVVVVIISAVLAAIYADYSYLILLIAALFILLFVFMIIQQFYRRMYTTYEITDSDVVWRFGVFAPDENLVPISEITNMKVDRSFLGIIFGFANLQFDTASAKTDFEITMKDIDAGQLKKALELIRSLRRETPQGSRMRTEPDQAQ
ncbi:MAG: PH domain-containing protein [Candidatus Micrarchaeota archaeon]|nr:PH domain-containing protein [Candidatus Micrarchaeota archaeon]